VRGARCAKRRVQRAAGPRCAHAGRRAIRSGQRHVAEARAPVRCVEIGNRTRPGRVFTVHILNPPFLARGIVPCGVPHLEPASPDSASVSTAPPGRRPGCPAPRPPPGVADQANRFDDWKPGSARKALPGGPRYVWKSQIDRHHVSRAPSACARAWAPPKPAPTEGDTPPLDTGRQSPRGVRRWRAHAGAVVRNFASRSRSIEDSGQRKYEDVQVLPSNVEEISMQGTSSRPIVWPRARAGRCPRPESWVSPTAKRRRWWSRSTADSTAAPARAHTTLKCRGWRVENPAGGNPARCGGP